MEVAIIGAVAAIIAAFIPLIWGSRQKKRAEKEAASAKWLISILEKQQPDSVDIYYEFDKYYFDIDKHGNCSLKKLVRIVPTEQAEKITNKKFVLYHSGIEFYLSKHKKQLSEINPDKEFNINVKDLTNKVKMVSSTEIEGAKKDEFITNVVFDNPLTPGKPIDLEIGYSNLDVCFFWKSLWEGRLDYWNIETLHDIKEYKFEILFPNPLPANFRQTEIGTVLIPEGWAELTQDILHNRKRLILHAENLQKDNTYKLKIDFS